MKKNNEKQIKQIKDITDDNQVITGENSVNTDEKLDTKPKRKGKHLFKSGDEWTGNRNGRPKGKRNYDKMVEDALINLEKKYKQNGIDIPDFELEIFEKLLNDVRAGKDKARELYFKYRYSQPKQTLELMGNVDVILSPSEQKEVDDMIEKFNNI